MTITRDQLDALRDYFNLCDDHPGSHLMECTTIRKLPPGNNYVIELVDVSEDFAEDFGKE